MMVPVSTQIRVVLDFVWIHEVVTKIFEVLYLGFFYRGSCRKRAGV